MSLIRSEETAPEKAVRSLLHKRGFRFRKNDKSLPGKPDIVLPKYKQIVFVHGCFWHQHIGCRRSVIPKSNTEYWVKKLSANAKRDEEVVDQLEELGWKVSVVWECEITDTEKCVSSLVNDLTKKKDSQKP